MISKMKKLKELKELQNIFVDSTNILYESIVEQLNKVKKEYQTNLVEEINKEKLLFLEQICKDEDLDFESLKSKYLLVKKSKESSKDKNKKDDDPNEELLNQIVINDTEYWYEPKEKGLVYNKDSKHVGYFKNGKVNIDSI